MAEHSSSAPVEALPADTTPPWWAHTWVHLVVLTVACLAVFANNFSHEYFLDDSYFITSNVHLRSLRNIPVFFADPGTFATYRANVDYRPVLSSTWALNYWMAGGYATPWWHATQILLHVVCATGLYGLARRLLMQWPAMEAEPARHAVMAMVCALPFAVHPTASGVINYMSARSSLLTAAFLVPAFVLYFVPAEDARWQRVPWGAVVLYALALFTKVEAVGALGVLGMYHVWQTARIDGHTRSFLGDVLHTVRPALMRRLWPFLLVTAAYFVIRAKLMAPYDFAESRGGAHVSGAHYFWTQTVVWWEYVAHWFAPVRLVADDAMHPVHRSPLDGPVPFALLGWAAVTGMLLRSWRRAPWLATLAVSALALLSPTSSFLPLAEMRNEHRPYLPMGLLAMTWLLPLGAALTAPMRRSGAFAEAVPLPVRMRAAQRMSMVLGTIAIGVLGTMTWQRNHAFSTNRAYLEDVVAKAPSGRALTNLGLSYMSSGDVRTALMYYTRALALAPNWYIVHINTAIAQRALGNTDRARWHINRAVEVDQYSGTALTWRADFALRDGRYEDAVRDLLAARPRSTDAYAICRGLAKGYAGVGDAARALNEARACARVDGSRFAGDIVDVAGPFFSAASRAAAGIQFFEGLEALYPDAWWVHANIATLARTVGDGARTARAEARARALRGGA